MRVSLLYINDCPNWHLADQRLAEALRRVGTPDQVVERLLISSDEQAHEARFLGSPTILVDGQDLFAASEAGPFGLTCRVYASEGMLTGSPTTDELVAALTAHA